MQHDQRAHEHRQGYEGQPPSAVITDPNPLVAEAEPLAEVEHDRDADEDAKHFGQKPSGQLEQSGRRPERIDD
jgi:hypothetical protein